MLGELRNTDPAGVEIGAALKNIIAIGAGICQGLGLGNNSIAALITRGLAEITRLAVAMGGQQRTLAGLGTGEKLRLHPQVPGRDRSRVRGGLRGAAGGAGLAFTSQQA